jgi:hypothetical protein
MSVVKAAEKPKARRLPALRKYYTLPEDQILQLLQDTVTHSLENGVKASKFPTLHSYLEKTDDDATKETVGKLRAEFAQIQEALPNLELVIVLKERLYPIDQISTSARTLDSAAFMSGISVTLPCNLPARQFLADYITKFIGMCDTLISRGSGFGKYTKSFTPAILENKNDGEVYNPLETKADVTRTDIPEPSTTGLPENRILETGANPTGIAPKPATRGLLEELDGLEMPAADYVIVANGPLESAGALDIIVTPTLWAEVARNYRSDSGVIKIGRIKLHQDFKPHFLTAAAAFNNSEVRGGHRFVKLGQRQP